MHSHSPGSLGPGCHVLGPPLLSPMCAHRGRVLYGGVRCRGRHAGSPVTLTVRTPFLSLSLLQGSPTICLSTQLAILNVSSSPPLLHGTQPTVIMDGGRALVQGREAAGKMLAGWCCQAARGLYLTPDLDREDFGRGIFRRAYLCRATQASGLQTHQFKPVYRFMKASVGAVVFRNRRMSENMPISKPPQ